LSAGVFENTVRIEVAAIPTYVGIARASLDAFAVETPREYGRGLDRYVRMP